MKYTIYTDGSAIKYVSLPTTPAGWGYLVIEGEVGAAHNGGTTIEENYGQVVTDRSSPLHVGAEVGSNNTAELSAIYWALDWISRSDALNCASTSVVHKCVTHAARARQDFQAL